MNLSNKFCKISQHWLTAEISSNRVQPRQWHELDVSINIINVNIECNVTAGATTGACTWYMNFRWACRWYIRYSKGCRRSFTFRSLYGALRIWQFAWWIKTVNCLIFTKKRSQLDCIYGAANVKCVCWTNSWNRRKIHLLLKKLHLKRNSLYPTLHS